LNITGGASPQESLLWRLPELAQSPLLCHENPCTQEFSPLQSIKRFSARPLQRAGYAKHPRFNEPFTLVALEALHAALPHNVREPVATQAESHLAETPPKDIFPESPLMYHRSYASKTPLHYRVLGVNFNRLPPKRKTAESTPIRRTPSLSVVASCKQEIPSQREQISPVEMSPLGE
jgi:hypothetical protein